MDAEINTPMLSSCASTHRCFVFCCLDVLSLPYGDTDPGCGLPSAENLCDGDAVVRTLGGSLILQKKGEEEEATPVHDHVMCVPAYSQQLGSSQLWAPPVPTTLVSGLGAETSTGHRLMMTMIPLYSRNIIQ